MEYRVCEAYQGSEACLKECKKKMGRNEFMIHVFKHHGIHLEGLQCALPGCNQVTLASRSIEELKNDHWKKSCNYLYDLYDICNNCGTQKLKRMKHTDCKELTQANRGYVEILTLLFDPDGDFKSSHQQQLEVFMSQKILADSEGQLYSISSDFNPDQ